MTPSAGPPVTRGRQPSVEPRPAPGLLRTVPPDGAIQVQVGTITEGGFVGQCLGEVDANTLVAQVQEQVQSFLPEAVVRQGCTELSEPQSGALQKATTVGLWLQRDKVDFDAALAKIDLFQGEGLHLGVALRMRLTTTLLDGLLAAALEARLDDLDLGGREIESRVVLGPTDATCTTHVGVSGLDTGIRYVEVLKPANDPVRRCQAPPPRVVCNTDRNLVGDVINWLKPALPERGVFGFMVDNSFFRSREAIADPDPRPSNLDPDDHLAVQFSYGGSDSLTIEGRGSNASLNVRASGTLEVRRPCVSILGNAGPVIDPRVPDPRFRYEALVSDMREPIRLEWGGSDGVTLSTTTEPVTFASFDADGLGPGETRNFALSVHATDADGARVADANVIRVQVAFIEASPGVP